jgi:hypothetical protein
MTAGTLSNRYMATNLPTTRSRAELEAALERTLSQYAEIG